MNKNIIRLAAIAALAVGAQAANISKTGVSPAGFVIPTSPTVGSPGGLPDGSGLFSYSILVPQITPAEITGNGGTLIGVTYTISVGTYAEGTLVGTAGSYAIQWGLAPIAGGNSGPGVSGNGPFGGSPGISINAVLVGGGSTLSGDVLNAPNAGYVTSQDVRTTGSLDDSANLASYQGLGDVTFNFTSKAFTSVGGISGTTSQTTPLAYQGASVTVTYVFSDVPEPSTYAAGAVLLAGAGFIARRRMQKA